MALIGHAYTFSLRKKEEEEEEIYLWCSLVATFFLSEVLQRPTVATCANKLLDMWDER